MSLDPVLSTSQAKATCWPFGEKLGADSAPGKVVSGTTLIEAGGARSPRHIQRIPTTAAAKQAALATQIHRRRPAGGAAVTPDSDSSLTSRSATFRSAIV